MYSSFILPVQVSPWCFGPFAARLRPLDERWSLTALALRFLLRLTAVTASPLAFIILTSYLSASIPDACCRLCFATRYDVVSLDLF